MLPNVEESSDSENSGIEGISINAPVTREGLLTKATRKRRREHKLATKKIQAEKDRRRRDTAMKKDLKVRRKETEAKRQTIKEMKQVEREIQEIDGVVKIPK